MRAQRPTPHRDVSKAGSSLWSLKRASTENLLYDASPVYDIPRRAFREGFFRRGRVVSVIKRELGHVSIGDFSTQGAI